MGLDARGIDTSDYAISHAASDVRDKVSCVDIEREFLPFPDRYFDLVTALEVVEHLLPEKTAFTFGEVRRVLKPGGVFFLTTPNPWGKNAKADQTHIQVQPRKSWVEMLIDTGFS